VPGAVEKYGFVVNATISAKYNSMGARRACP
jgi:hypothetical protein